MQLGTGWSVSGTQLDFIIQDVISHYRVATNRIYLTGISAGGAGILQYCLHQDDNAKPTSPPKWKVAAIVPMSEAFGVPSQAACDSMANSGVQIWGFGDPNKDIHGENTQSFIIRINKLGKGLARFTATNSGHGGWTKLYDPEYREKITVNDITSPMNIYEWMLNFSTNISSVNKIDNNTSNSVANSIQTATGTEFKEKSQTA